MSTRTDFRRKQFIAIDGEGVTQGREHYYNLLVARDRYTDRTLFLHPYQGQKRLSTSQILYILTHLPRHNRIYVMYYFSYDVTKMLEDMSIADKIALWKNKIVIWHDEELDCWYKLVYMPHKFLRVQEFYRGHWYGNTIFDVFGFFQTSFATALLNWKICTPEELEYIQSMKNERAHFSVDNSHEIEKYCALECDYLCQLMERVRDALADENILISRWFGAGAIGEQLLHREHMQPYLQSPAYMNEYLYNPDFRLAVRGAYFGGRFELCRQGVIPRTHQYDINSAYPYASLSVPDLDNCRIEYTAHYNDSEYALWFVTYDVRKNNHVPLFGPLPYRKKNGTVLYPYYNRYGVWVHAVELHAAMKLYGKHCFTVHKGYVIIPGTQEKPFSWVNDIAAHRLRLKKSGDLRNIVLKLGLNSIYGKCAQGQGGNDDKLPPFQNYYVAGYITAHCRAQLLQIAWSCGYHGSGVIQFATDGIFSMVASDILGSKTSETLGAWEYTFHDKDIVYVQPGVYFSRAKDISQARKSKRRTRGFRANRLTADEVFVAWQMQGPFAKLSVADSQFFGIGSCLVYKDWTRYGRWIETPHTLSFDVPPTKTYINGESLLPRTIMWSRRLYTISGISEAECKIPASNYYVLLTDTASHVKQPSLPYPEKKQASFILTEKNNKELAELRKQEIASFDQGDYERLSAFDPFALRM